MELRRYLEIIGRRWWILLTAFVVTTSLTVVLVIQQQWVYGSGGTFVVRPRSVETEEVVRAIDTLIRGVEINSTYATIARSDLIRERAKARLGPSFSTSGLSVEADVMPGTNVLRIDVRGPDPEAVATFAEAVGAESVAYIADLEDAFELRPLDPPKVSASPIAPNKPLTVVLGMVFGAMLGVLAAIGAEYLSSSQSPLKSRSRSARPDGKSNGIRDADAGTHTEGYFNARFAEESSRAEHSGREFCVGLLRLVPAPKSGARDLLVSIVQAADGLLRREDVATITDHADLMILFPDMGVDNTEVVMARWQEIAASVVADGRGDWHDVEVSVGVASYIGSEEVAGPLGEHPLSVP